ncbi:MAG: MFS transporter [Chlamydiales bacterium]|nr:MFS transporter [Chlamydiia bacterium]MCP5507422.1 MFS transporter [Chlamydiales bacterium]
MTTISKKRFSSFTYLNTTQFLGALNDNIFKLLIVYFFIDLEGVENSYRILSAAGATFVAPFLLFSTSSGFLADRFSKRNIIVLTKLLELVIMLLGVLFFYFQSKLGSFFILFMLATQSALFGPSKYGILPEIVEEEKISRANGLMSSFTFLAIILGTFLASFIVDMSGRSYIIAAGICTLFSLIGFLASLRIEYTPPAGAYRRFNIFFFSEIYKSIKIAAREPSLMPAILGSAFFLFLGAYVQLNMIPYATNILNMTDVQGGYLFLLTAVGIGTGSVIAGKISGKSVELGLVPVAGLLIAATVFLLDYYSDNLLYVIPLVVATGIFGGIYLVPLDSFIQIAAPNKYRGLIVATANFIGFIGVLLASLFIWVITEALGLQADKGFSIVGICVLLVALLFGFQFFDYTTRFICMVLSKLHFQSTVSGIDNIPANKPAIYVCRHTAWNDTLLMLGSQRRRMRFFIEQEQDHSKILKRLYRMLRVVLMPDIETLDSSRPCIEAIKKSLKKGISVCIFVENENLEEEIAKLAKTHAYQELLSKKDYPVIPVTIIKGVKDKESRVFTRLMAKLRVPAAVTFG